MKRITAYLKGKIEVIKCASREKRVNSALEAAKINFEEQIADADTKIDKFMSELGTTDDVQSIIQNLSDCMDDKEEAERGIKRLEEIKSFMNEEVETKED
jgi:hypothetical protein